MARLGEIARPQNALPSQPALAAVPWPEDIIGRKVTYLLGEIGSKSIKEAPAEWLSGAPAISAGEVGMRMMPCGLYGAEVRLPEGFLRLTSVKMAGWSRSVCSLIIPGSAEWCRQWSAETGISGCHARPRAYLDCGGDGFFLRLLGSECADDSLEWLCGWCVPAVDEEGFFEFPEGLYSELAGAIADRLA